MLDALYALDAVRVHLWKRLDAAAKPHAVTWKWVKGHAGNPNNERCDELATTAADGSGLKPDRGFEQQEAGAPELDL